MIKINLAPTAKKGRVPKARRIKGPALGIKLPSVQATVLYIIGLVVVVAVVTITLLTQSNKIGSLDNNIKQLNAKLEELKIYKATVDSLERRERELGMLIWPIRELNQNRFFIAHIIEEISERIPSYTWLTRLELSQSEIKLNGITASNLLVADFMNRLEESPYISNVDLTVLEKKAVGKMEMMDFKLTANAGYDTLPGRLK